LVRTPARAANASRMRRYQPGMGSAPARGQPQHRAPAQALSPDQDQTRSRSNPIQIKPCNILDGTPVAT
jgi:hypothetical protein